MCGILRPSQYNGLLQGRTKCSKIFPPAMFYTSLLYQYSPWYFCYPLRHYHYPQGVVCMSWEAFKWYIATYSVRQKVILISNTCAYSSLHGGVIIQCSCKRFSDSYCFYLACIQLHITKAKTMQKGIIKKMATSPTVTPTIMAVSVRGDRL